MNEQAIIDAAKRDHGLKFEETGDIIQFVRYVLHIGHAEGYAEKHHEIEIDKITARDTFAAQAMNALLISNRSISFNANELVNTAYEVADIMMKRKEEYI